MAMAMAMAALVVLLLAAPAVHAVQHVVGDSAGWDQGIDYSTWAASKKFTVGDTLVFTYSLSHSVDVVSKSDYTNCASGNALKSYTDGDTTITLDTAGPIYFLCPAITHCQIGMKLAITVAAAASTTPSVASPPPSTTTPSVASPPPSTTTPSVASPPPSTTTPSVASPPPSSTKPSAPSPPPSSSTTKTNTSVASPTPAPTPTPTSPSILSPASPSSGTSTGSPTPSTAPAITNTTASTSQGSSGAGGRFGNVNYLVIGLSVVVASLIGLMG